MSTRTPPAKPWEQRRVGTTTESGSLAPSLSQSSSPLSTLSSSLSTPRLPARPYGTSSLGSYGGYGSNYGSYGSGYGGYGSSYGTSRYGGYGSSYGSSYGGYGGYGTSRYGGYGSYGTSYGGYGSSYGGYGNYSRYGSNPPLRPGEEQPPGTMSFFDSKLRRFGGFVESFGRFSGLLDANFDAVNGSFFSILRMFDLFGEFFHVIRNIAIFRMLFSVIRKFYRTFLWMLGRDFSLKRVSSSSSSSSQNSTTSNNPLVGDYEQFQNAQKRQRSIRLFLFLLFATICATPFLLIKLLRVTKNPDLEAIWNSEDEISSSSSSSPTSVKALYDFEPQSENELPFRKNETIKILGKPFPEWWEGELNGRKGLIPATYVQEFILDPKIQQLS